MSNPTGPRGLTHESCAAALARLPGMGPANLVAILRDHEPAAAWEMILAGKLERPPKPGRTGGQHQLFAESEGDRTRRDSRSWAAVASRMDVIVLWDRAQKAGVRVAWFGSNDYPARLVGDPNPPGVLFWRGSLGCLSRPTAAIVGTRNATPDGRAIAFELGRDLAEAGVCVVSGLALGVDGAAHHGALDSFESDPEKRGCAPLGAAASGVDVPYPRRHSALWERVCEAGAIVSETPPGQPAQAWRFPTRNRIIAALSDLVVVVESHPTGGSLITAEAALERGIEVRAVPGPVRSPASEGCHQLLYDGAGPVRGARDVLDALGVFLPSDSLPRIGRGRARSPGQDGERRPVDQLNSVGRAILDAVGWRPTSVGLIVERTGLGLGEVAGALERLEALGLADRQGGWWTRV